MLPKIFVPESNEIVPVARRVRQQLPTSATSSVKDWPAIGVAQASEKLTLTLLTVTSTAFDVLAEKAAVLAYLAVIE